MDERTTRRSFLRTGGALAAAGLVGACPRGGMPVGADGTGGEGEASTPVEATAGREPQPQPGTPAGVTLFLAGDVMTGRGIDQVFPTSADPRLYESYVRDARDYVELAERAHGAIPRDAEPSYVWGAALEELERVAPALRFANLETAVTAGGSPWPGKGIHYRMHPANVDVLAALGLDGCSLANNHALDWSVPGLVDSLEALEGAGIRAVGAGRDAEAAAAPGVFGLPGGGRVSVYAFGAGSSGIPRSWQATAERPGLEVLPDLSPETTRRVVRRIRGERRPEDLVVVSVHQGGNWGYEIPPEQRRFAHALVDEAGVDVVHGHSSHHPKGIEVYEGRPVLYGCGDFLNDYEGIGGREEYRAELVLMYFPTLDPATGELLGLTLTPLETRRFRLRRPSSEDVEWLARVLDRESRELGARVERTEAGRLALGW